ncbi:MAG: class I SAM-dependent methyltransferase [Candidatus Omnitrophica bacterium]|nr:class I SAM-dependent methyltransferase [Candidatus Omnitrophota bacterium]
MGNPKILDIGCGGSKSPGAVGIDRMPQAGVDVVHDLNKIPWPFGDNTFDLVACQDTIQILDSILDTMNEIHRVSKPGAVVKIRTPHYSHPNSWKDPLHKWHLAFDSFDYFLEDFGYPRYTDRKYRMIRKEFIFNRKFGIGNLLAKISPRRYEKYYCHRYPPYNMYFELEVVK